MTNGGRGAIDTRALIGLAAGVLAPIAAALVLVPFRDDIDNANLALLLVLVVVLVAIAFGRRAAVLAAISATLSFDFFLTRPYVSMRIESADDIETVLIMLAVGLLVGEMAQRGRRSRRSRARAADAISRVHRVGEQVTFGAPLADVAATSRRELVELLRLHDCWIEVPPFTWALPQLARDGTIEVAEHVYSDGGFTIPEDGIELPILRSGDEIARLILLGDPDVSTSIEERVIAVAIADQLGQAAARAGPEELAHLAER